MQPQLNKKDYGINQMMRQLSSGELLLPAIQRDYVWTDEDVYKFIESIYRNRPLGGQFHIWEPDSKISSVFETARTISGDEIDPTLSSSVGFIIDGQQRLTSLKRVYDDTLDNEIDILFDPVAEKFLGKTAKNSNKIYNHENQVRSKFKYVSVRSLWRDSEYLDKLVSEEVIKYFEVTNQKDFDTFKKNSIKLAETLQALQFNCIVLRGHSHHEIVDIFILLNSAGKNVSAPEKIIMPMLIQSVPNIRQSMSSFIKDKIKANHSDFVPMIDVNFLATTMMYQLYGYTNVIKNFSKEKYEPKALQKALEVVLFGIDETLRLLSNQLGINSRNMVESPFSLQVLALALGNREIDKKKQKRAPLTAKEQSAAILYFLASNSKSRYSKPNHMRIRSADIDIAKSSDALSSLSSQMIEYKDRNDGSNWFNRDDLKTVVYSQGKNHPLMLLLGIVLYKQGALAFHDGNSVIDFRHSQKHHIFPRSQMKKHKNHKDVDNIGNITYIHQTPNNLEFNDRLPSDYLADIRNLEGLDSNDKVEALTNHFIVSDEKYWEQDKFDLFIEVRQGKIVDAFNKILIDYARRAGV